MKEDGGWQVVKTRRGKIVLAFAFDCRSSLSISSFFSPTHMTISNIKATSGIPMTMPTSPDVREVDKFDSPMRQRENPPGRPQHESGRPW